MTPKQEAALWQALETFERMGHKDSIFAGEFNGEITALREALAEQPAQQEPVAWMTEDATNGVNVWLFKKTALKYSSNPLPLYTSPPASKPWVGLTEEDRVEIWKKSSSIDGAINATATKLREKNT